VLFEESEPERSRGVSTQESSMERSTEASDGGSGGTGPPRKKSTKAYELQLATKGEA
jgi:hypothetical protein